MSYTLTLQVKSSDVQGTVNHHDFGTVVLPTEATSSALGDTYNYHWDGIYTEASREGIAQVHTDVTDSP